MKFTNEELVKGLQIVEIKAFSSELCPNGAIRIHWCGAAGFGQYDLVIGKDGVLHGYSEHMESNEDKYFSKELLRLLHEAIVVEE
jgi:hypothetical protein